MKPNPTRSGVRDGRGGRQPWRSEALTRHRAPGLRRRAYTLVELMVVVAIMAVVMTIAIPTLYRTLHPDSMQRAVEDFMEAFRVARASAILDGHTAAVVVDLEDKGGGVTSQRFWVEGAQQRGGGGSWTNSDKIAIADGKVNFIPFMELDQVRVCFYPNGTCDEFEMKLFRPDTGERRVITLEVMTGLADVESDPLKMR